MLNKKVLNFLLNVKHTVIDDVKIFDDDSIVFYVHPTKSEQCRCGICGRKAPYYDAGRGLRLWRATDVGRILRTFKIKKNVEVTDNGKIII